MATFENFTEGGRVAALDKQVGQVGHCWLRPSQTVLPLVMGAEAQLDSTTISNGC